MKCWLSSLCISAVTLAAPQASAGCSKDTDCKGERICVSGACTAPDATPAAAPATTAPPTAPPVVTLTEPMIVEIYMKGDVTSAITEANTAKLTDLAARLTAVSQAYGAAYAARQAGRSDEAIRQYELVIQYDRAVATRDDAYSSAAREALTALYAERSRQPAAPVQPYAAPVQSSPQQYGAPPIVAAPAGDRTVSFSGRSLEYVIDGNQRCTAPCSLTLPSGAHVMEVRGLGRYRLMVNTDVTRVEAKKGSPAAAIIGGIALAASPFLFWAGAVTPVEYNATTGKTDDSRKVVAYISGALFGLVGLIALPTGIVEATRTNVTINGGAAYRAGLDVKFTPMLAFTGNGGFLGGQLSF